MKKENYNRICEIMNALEKAKELMDNLIADPNIVLEKQTQEPYSTILRIPTGQFVNESFGGQAKKFLADVKSELQSRIETLEKELEGL